MTETSRPIRWRVAGISAADGETRYVVLVAASDGQTREYLLSRDAITIEDQPAFGWDATGWDEHTLYDRGSSKPVMVAAKAFYTAHQREIALGDTDNREPRPGVVWRLTGIRATDDESRYHVVVSGPDGQTRDYEFIRNVLDMSGEPFVLWKTGAWDRDTLYDRASFKAVMDAVLAFYEARQREMALGDDENRKPPGL